MFKKIMIYVLLAIVVAAALLILAGYVLYATADLKQPDYSMSGRYTPEWSDSLRSYGPSALRLNDKGIWEMKVYGDGFERGEAIGIIAKDLVYYQEKVFVDQIRRLVPSDSYLKFLHFVVVTFNRNLGKNVPREYRDELYGMSLSCTHDFDAIGDPYFRQMNYHSAHDLGHALQDYMMVGCSSFACWGGESSDGSMLAGRNFDFYMGDDFARNKLITFCFPDEGYRFASVGWPGMIGVMSGMNETGLTVTINASRSDVPTSSATPISILAREILQYASTIGEAWEIAEKRKTFVSESILICSRNDGKAAIIEKSPERMALYAPEDERIVCTNHYQSQEYGDDRRNLENIRTSDSRYRFDRINELMDRLSPLDVDEAASILRNRRGLGDCVLGNTNEMAVNQLIAHHSVIFRPDSLLMWVSTGPWQCGEYIAYDLDEIFKENVTFTSGLCREDLSVPQDPFLGSAEFNDVLLFRSLTGTIREQARKKEKVPQYILSQYLRSNPDFYGTYKEVGDYYFAMDLADSARTYWRKALDYPVPKKGIEEDLKEKIGEL